MTHGWKVLLTSSIESVRKEQGTRTSDYDDLQRLLFETRQTHLQTNKNRMKAGLLGRIINKKIKQ